MVCISCGLSSWSGTRAVEEVSDLTDLFREGAFHAGFAGV